MRCGVGGRRLPSRWRTAATRGVATSSPGVWRPASAGRRCRPCGHVAGRRLSPMAIRCLRAVRRPIGLGEGGAGVLVRLSHQRPRGCLPCCPGTAGRPGPRCNARSLGARACFGDAVSAVSRSAEHARVSLLWPAGYHGREGGPRAAGVRRPGALGAVARAGGAHAATTDRQCPCRVAGGRPVRRRPQAAGADGVRVTSARGGAAIRRETDGPAGTLWCRPLSLP